MKNSNMLFVMILMLTALFLSACGDKNSQPSASSDNNAVTNTSEGDGDTYEFKITYVTQTGHNWHKFAEKFKDELDQRSDGRMNLELYPAAQLGPEADMVQQMANGSLDFALLTVPYLSTRIEEFDAWNMPFLFENLEEGIQAAETEPAQKMLKLLEEQGLKGIGYLHTGTHSLIMKDAEINTIEDVNGKKLRFTGGASVLGFWEDLGASPIAMGLPEVYNALQTGVIDGVSVDTNATLSEKYHEISEGYVLTKHMVFGGVLAASLTNYENMPESDRKIIDEAMAAALEWGNEQLVINDVEDLKEVSELLNVTELDNRDEFVEAAQEVHEEYAKKNELIKEFIDVVKGN
ncbi:TRAP transporter substrate-binding protein [Pseudogracilibacillus sp. SO30301A]|uniref:TRAP transporter substrate-binding protein n=1 Tax=Pseudogracilibacillus sp. SO30301A TaxID=3098291 RepID=UPI00300E5E9B